MAERAPATDVRPFILGYTAAHVRQTAVQLHLRYRLTLDKRRPVLVTMDPAAVSAASPPAAAQA